jgi:hypothetical protein
MNAKTGQGTSSTWVPSIHVTKDELYKLIRGVVAINSKTEEIENINTPNVARFALKSEPGSGIPDYGVLEIHKKTQKLMIIFRGSQVDEDWNQVNLKRNACERKNVAGVHVATVSGIHCGILLGFNFSDTI